MKPAPPVISTRIEVFRPPPKWPRVLRELPQVLRDYNIGAPAPEIHRTLTDRSV